MAFGDEFQDLSNLLSQVGKNATTSDNLKDYAHASKLIRPGGMALAPNQKFLFHVYFNLTDPSLMAGVTGGDNGLIGALVKTVQLPAFTLDTEEYIQYNRKRLVHNRIKYEPVQLTFHDDAKDIIRQLWNKYYTYHFSDAKYQYESGIPGDSASGKADYNSRDIYNGVRSNQQAGWGKSITNPSGGNTKPAFFKDITIYGMSRGQFRSYTLVNPVITAWRHDQYDYAAGDGVMQHDVTIQYETVKYGSGAVGKAGASNVKGFAPESRYDTVAGALGPGKAAATFGLSGLEGTFDSLGKDLAAGNILGALVTAGRANNTFDGQDLIGILKEDINRDATNKIKGAVGSAGSQYRSQFSYPTAKNITQSTSASPRADVPIATTDQAAVDSENAKNPAKPHAQLEAEVRERMKKDGEL